MAAGTTKPPRQLSPAGVKIVKNLESKNGIPNLEAYEDDGGVWTSGWGHTGPEVVEGYKVTVARAERDLDNDLDEAEFAVCKYVDYKQLSTNEFDALVIFVFNTGPGSLLQPHMAAALRPDPVTGRIDREAVAAQFPKWVWVTNRKTGKKYRNNGLINRRAAELTLWNTPDAEKPEEQPAIQTVLPSIAQEIVPPITRVEAKDVPITVPPVSSSATPVPPPAKISQSPGGKSFLTVIGSVMVASLTNGYDQIVALADKVNKVKTGLDGYGKWGHIAGITFSVVVIGVAIYTYLQRHREVAGDASN